MKTPKTYTRVQLQQAQFSFLKEKYPEKGSEYLRLTSWNDVDEICDIADKFKNQKLLTLNMQAYEDRLRDEVENKPTLVTWDVNLGPSKSWTVTGLATISIETFYKLFGNKPYELPDTWQDDLEKYCPCPLCTKKY